MRTIQEQFEYDENRIKNFVLKIDVGSEQIYFDHSKTHLSADCIRNYSLKFRALKLEDRIKELFNGGKINFTENRKVLHTLLRDAKILKKIQEDNDDILEGNEYIVHQELLKMQEYAETIKTGATGKIIDTIVNIGIGGSDLGPRMVCEALEFYKIENMKVHFISNVDATETKMVFDKIDPEKTLFIVVSKTFTTQETLSNAILAREIFAKKTGISVEDITNHHFVAVSSNDKEVKNFGIKKIFNMWDFVGGRYSLWSAVGLSICLYIGFDKFIELLVGASIMDENFRTKEVFSNVSLFHAIVELFYNEEGYNNKCILPYDTYLSRLPAYFQQAEMESNGKTAMKSTIGKSAKSTGMIIWGEVGTNSQHSFFQLIHQGTRQILCEFFVGINPLNNCCDLMQEHHRVLYANCLAQSEALMIGKENKDNHKNFPGDKPSMTTIYSKLTPGVLGALIAMVEHKIFCQGIFWNINSFDQFGVELGKSLAKTLTHDLKEGHDDLGAGHDPSTNNSISLFTNYFKK